MFITRTIAVMSFIGLLLNGCATQQKHDETQSEAFKQGYKQGISDSVKVHKEIQENLKAEDLKE
ncbi:MAG: hypothetical protein WAX69_08590 [Victivallales bacterium]